MGKEMDRRFLKPEIIGSGITVFLLVAALNMGDARSQPVSADVNSGSASAERSSRTINVLDYFFTQNSGFGLKSASHNLNQVIRKNGDGSLTSFYVKFNGKFEEHQYDPVTNTIYLLRDNTDGENGPYSAPLKMPWLPGKAKVGDEFSVTTELYRYDKNCRSDKLPVRHEYAVKILARDPHYDLQGDLDIVDLLLMEYKYRGGREEFGYAKGWGWVLWRWYNGQDTLLKEEIFNRITFGVVQPNLAAGC